MSGILVTNGHLPRDYLDVPVLNDMRDTINPARLSASGQPMLQTGADLRELQAKARRGMLWRLGFITAALALLGLSSLSLNAMRLFTITSAPSYVPMGVIDYWLASGAVMGALLVLLAEMLIYAWSAVEGIRQARGRGYPVSPLDHRAVPPPPPNLQA